MSKEITVEKLTQEEAKQRGILSWPTWGCDVSTFDWHYDEPEVCYLLKGRVRVEPKDGRQPAEFGAGDYVSFPEGMSCVWKVSQAVHKHYKFG